VIWTGWKSTYFSTNKKGVTFIGDSLDPTFALRPRAYKSLAWLLNWLPCQCRLVINSSGSVSGNRLQQRIGWNQRLGIGAGLQRTRLRGERGLASQERTGVHWHMNLAQGSWMLGNIKNRLGNRREVRCWSLKRFSHYFQNYNYIFIYLSKKFEF
jgi:hypothetical protein